jgi:hypothetical protein
MCLQNVAWLTQRFTFCMRNAVVRVLKQINNIINIQLIHHEKENRIHARFFTNIRHVFGQL